MRTRRGAPRLLVFPAWKDNQYLRVLHQAPSEAGVEILRARRRHLNADAKSVRRGDVLHIHWTQRVAQKDDNEKQAWSSVKSFTGFVRRLQRRGVRVVWTVHNVLPHETRFLEPELFLFRFLAESADRVHIMTAETPQVVEHLYELPADRLLHIPHFSYRGVYGEPPPRGQAKRALGLEEDEPTVLFFGRMHAYKGLDTLMEAVRLVGERGASVPTLLLAGQPETSSELARIEAMLPPTTRVVKHLGYVDDDDIPTWFGAADVAVFPYERILNSGSVHLSATMGVPAVLPGESHLLSQFRDEPWVRFYDPDDAAASLAQVLAQPDDADHADAMARFSDRLAPEKVSQQYLDALRELVHEPSRAQTETGLFRRATHWLRRG